SETVATDASWTGSNGPIFSSDLLDGETYDARAETAGWDSAGDATKLWAPVAVIGTPGPKLVAQVDDGVQVEAERPAMTVNEVKPGVFVYTLGQNIVGWERLRVQGAAGAVLTLRFAEVLNGDGTVYTTNMRGAAETDHYTLKGGGMETFEPRFTSHGFQYVE